MKRAILAILAVALVAPGAAAWDQLGGGPGHAGTAVLVDGPLDVLVSATLLEGEARFLAGPAPEISFLERGDDLLAVSFDNATGACQLRFTTPSPAMATRPVGGGGARAYSTDTSTDGGPTAPRRFTACTR